MMAIPMILQFDVEAALTVGPIDIEKEQNRQLAEWAVARGIHDYQTLSEIMNGDRLCAETPGRFFVGPLIKRRN